MRITVEHLSGDAFRIATRGHEVVVDQPRNAGGDDGGPTPTELFVAALASCVAYYAERVLRRESATDAGVRVDCDWTMSPDPPWRVADIDVRVAVTGALSEQRLAAVRRAVTQCTVHNSILHAPRMSIAVETEAAAAA